MARELMKMQLKTKMAGRVLCIGSENLFSSLFFSQLTQQGLDYVFQSSIEVGIKYATEGHFHAVISDCLINHGERGLAAMETLHASGIPVVVVVDEKTFDSAKNALNHGASYLLQQPFILDELITALQNLWDRPQGLNALVDRFLDLHHLTPKEKEVARLVLKGLANKEIASAENTSDRTVKAHLTSIFQKCRVTSRTELFNAIFPT